MTLHTTPPDDENEMLPVHRKGRVYFVPRHLLATHHTEKRWVEILTDCESVTVEKYDANQKR